MILPRLGGPILHGIWCRVLVFAAPLCLCQLGCGTSEQSSSVPYLTVTAVKQPFTISLNMQGELEAKVSRALTTPQVRTRPTVAYLADEGASVKTDDIVVEFESEELVKNYRIAADEVAIARAESKQKEADLTLQRLMLEAEMHRLDSVAATARLQLPKLQFAAPRLREIQELEMRKSELEAEKIKTKISSLKEIEREELQHLRLKEQQADLKLKSTVDFLNKLTIRAPVDGILIRSTNWGTGNKVQEGDALWGGWPVANIPDLSVMQVKARVGETDAQRLEKDQEAVVSIPSMAGLSLPARVTNVANVATPIKRNSKVKMVEVTLEIDSTDTRLAPGLTADCLVTIETVEDVIVVPKECVFERDSTKVVYTQDNGLFRSHTVKTAEQSNDFVVITEGVPPGSMLVLREPEPSLILNDRL